MLRLPNEILLEIAGNLSKLVKYEHPQRDLQCLALTCKRLAPIARETLLHAPILHSSKTHLLLETLFKYPQLCTNVRSLTIETIETRGRKALPTPISRLEPELLRSCIRKIESLPYDNETKKWWAADLEASVHKYHGPLLCLLLAMVPRLEELYLGGSVLFNLPFLRDMLPELNDMLDMHHRFPVGQISNWDVPNLSCILSELGPKLKVLELPNEFRISAASQPWNYKDVDCISKYFPELRELILPACTVVESRHVDIIPPNLQALTLTWCDGEDHDDWVHDLIRLKIQHRFQHLSTVVLYHAHPDDNGLSFPNWLVMQARLQITEFYPHCNFWVGDKWSGDELYHPWIYSRAELEVLDLDRHEKEKDRLVDLGLQSLRYLFLQDSQ